MLHPLRDEAQMVPLLRQAMMRLDYPPHLLDVNFVVEAKSPQTVAAVEQSIGDPRFPDDRRAARRTAHQAQGAGLRAAAGARRISSSSTTPRMFRTRISCGAQRPASAPTLPSPASKPNSCQRMRMRMR